MLGVLVLPVLGVADRVLDRMAAKASRAVAVLDIPDLAAQEAALEYRRASTANYATEYEGLSHLFYDRSWFAQALRDRGFSAVQARDQDLAKYGNAPFRFNAWGFKMPG